MSSSDKAQGAPALVKVVSDATRHAVTRFHAERDDYGETFCVYALVTSGEGMRPYLTVTVDGPDRWNLADSPYAIVGDDWLAQTESAFSARGDLFRGS